jgi:uncharacterized protein YcnI
MQLETSVRLSAIVIGISTWLLTSSTASFAHARLEQETAISGESYRGVMQIAHGCDGSHTVTVRIRIPSGVKQVQGMAKAGWTLNVVMEKLDQPYELQGSQVTEEVREIAWTDGSLSDNHIDEFVFSGILPEIKTETTLYFATVQQCENGELHRWIEIPEAGQSLDTLEKPAPFLMITPEQLPH